MSNADVVRAWKDPEYRSTLNFLPTHPAGQIELADPDLDASSVRNTGFRLERVMHRHSKFCSFLTTHPGGCCK